jgi:hypothetical protein
MDELRTRLKKVEEERQVLLTLLQGYEGWLRLFANGSARPPHPMLDMRPKGTISLRKAIRQIVQEARGIPVHAKEIWLRAHELGAMTGASDPVAAVDYTAYSIKGIKKVAPRTWRWVGEPQGPSEVLGSLPEDGSRMVGPAGPRQPIEGE